MGQIKVNKFVMVGMSLLLLCSCIPAKISLTPGLNGTVVDKGTNTPVSGVMLHLEKNHEISTVTDSKGHFKLPPVRKWEWFVIMGVLVDHMSPVDSLVVSAKGYKPYKTEPIIYSPYTDRLILRNIQLEVDE